MTAEQKALETQAIQSVLTAHKLYEGAAVAPAKATAEHQGPSLVGEIATVNTEQLPTPTHHGPPCTGEIATVNTEQLLTPTHHGPSWY